MVLRGPTRSVVAKEVAAAKIINKRGQHEAVIRRRKMMTMMRTKGPPRTSSRKLRRPCVSTVAARCIPLTTN